MGFWSWLGNLAVIAAGVGTVAVTGGLAAGIVAPVAHGLTAGALAGILGASYMEISEEERLRKQLPTCP